MTDKRDSLVAEYGALSTRALQSCSDFMSRVEYLHSGANAMTSRGEALKAEHAQRARAGVRVNPNAGDLDSRTIAFYCEQATHWSTAGAATSERALVLQSMLLEAILMCARMVDALNAPEHAAAVRAQAEADAQAAEADAQAAEQAAVEAKAVKAAKVAEAKSMREAAEYLLSVRPELRDDAQFMAQLRILEGQWAAVL